MATNKKESKKVEKFLKTARKRFNLADEAVKEIRKKGDEDLQFRLGNQWDDFTRKQRESYGRPCLTINRTPQFIKQITNDMRQNRPSVNVSPVDDLADKDTAKIFKGIIRNIEYNSNAHAAYDYAFECAVTRSYGYWRIATDYINPESFDQEILIERIKNPNAVFLDPTAVEPDGSDADWGFVFEDVLIDDYKAMYPNSELASMDDWSSIGEKAQGWASSDRVRVCEYFYKDQVEDTLYLLEDGSTIFKSELPEDFEDFQLIKNERKTTTEKVKWAKINACEILEETEIPSRFIPIVPVLGDEIDDNGKTVLESVVRNTKDPQKMLNYWASAETEAITQAPLSPFIVAEGQVEGYEEIWQNANKVPYAFLPYKPTDLSGQMVSPPQRNSFEPAVMAITNARIQASQDLKDTSGIQDASLGMVGNETSGVAIQRRNMQSQTANYHFIDNFMRSIKHTGRILVEMIPKIYDAERTVRIIGEDKSEEIVKINSLFERDGKAELIDLSRGRYDVTISTGPSFTSKRQEAAQSMIEMSRNNPKFVEIAGDLMIKNQDWPGADEISERFKRTINPQILGEEQEQVIPPQVQAQMQQSAAMIDALTKQLNDATEEIKTKRLELESEERIAVLKMETDIRKEQIKAESSRGFFLAEQQAKELEKRQALLNSEVPMDLSFGPPEMHNPNFNQVGNEVPPEFIQGPTGEPLNEPGYFVED